MSFMWILIVIPLSFELTINLELWKKWQCVFGFHCAAMRDWPFSCLHDPAPTWREGRQAVYTWDTGSWCSARPAHSADRAAVHFFCYCPSTQYQAHIVTVAVKGEGKLLSFHPVPGTHCHCGCEGRGEAAALPPCTRHTLWLWRERGRCCPSTLYQARTVTVKGEGMLLPFHPVPGTPSLRLWRERGSCCPSTLYQAHTVTVKGEGTLLPFHPVPGTHCDCEGRGEAAVLSACTRHTLWLWSERGSCCPSTLYQALTVTVKGEGMLLPFQPVPGTHCDCEGRGVAAALPPCTRHTVTVKGDGTLLSFQPVPGTHWLWRERGSCCPSTLYQAHSHCGCEGRGGAAALPSCTRHTLWRERGRCCPSTLYQAHTVTEGRGDAAALPPCTRHSLWLWRERGRCCPFSLYQAHIVTVKVEGKLLPFHPVPGTHCDCEGRGDAAVLSACTRHTVTVKGEGKLLPFHPCFFLDEWLLDTRHF